MQVTLFGGLTIEHDGVETVVSQRRLRRLLAILVTENGHPMTIDRLIDLAWPDGPPPSAETSIHVAVSKLRRLLEPDLAPREPSQVLVTVEGGYLLDLDDDQLDLARFQRAARAALEPGAPAELAGQAWSQWRGRPFGDLADESWAVEPVRRLTTLRLNLLVRRAEHALRAGDGEIVTDLLAEHRRDPLDERLAGLTMLALYGIGRQADALAVARTVRHALRDELGLDPTSELQRIEQSILERDPGLRSFLTERGWTASDPDEPHGGAEIDLIGRAVDLDHLETVLRTRALVTLAGPAGCGKTSLARAVAARARRARPTFVDLSAVEDQDRVLRSISDALSLVAEPSRTLLQALAGALSREPSLLVLDNCEHITAEVGSVAAELASLEGVTVLATSRRPLGRIEETVVRLDPLAVPAEGAAEAEVQASPACELLARRGSIDIDSTNHESIGALARRLDGLPLALELAAHRLRTLGPLEVLRQILDDRDFQAPTGSDPSHQSLDASLRRSMVDLTADDLAVLDAVATFVAPVPLAAVDQLSTIDDLVRTSVSLERLAERHLLYVTADGAGHFGMLETVRASRRRSLAAEETLDAWRRRHVEVVASVAQASGSPSGIELADIEAEIGVALDHLEALSEPANGPLHHQLVTSVGSFWYRSGRLREAQERMQTAIATYPDVDPLWKGITLAAAGLISFSSGDFHGIDRLLGEAVDVLGAAGVPGLELLEAARHCSRRELDEVDHNVATALGSGRVRGMQQAIALDIAAYSAWFRADYAAAIVHFEAQQQAAAEAGDRFLEGRAIRGRGLMLAYQGHLESGALLCEESLRMISDWRNDRAVAQYLAIRAAVAFEFGNVETAHSDAVAAMRRASVRFDGNPMMVAVPVLAAALVDGAHFTAAARATGWLRGICAATGMYLPVASERLTERAEQQARDQLGPAAWSAARAAGAAGGLAGLVAEIDQRDG